MTPYEKDLLQEALLITSRSSSSTSEKSCSEKLVFAFDVALTVPEAARTAFYEASACMARLSPDAFLVLSQLRNVVRQRMLEAPRVVNDAAQLVNEFRSRYQ